MPILDQMIWLAICIYHEARSEPFQGQVAIGHVILNRAEKNKQNVRDIIYQPNQFSWTKANSFTAITEYEAFVTAVNAAMQAQDEHNRGNTFKDADHFHATYVKPTWASNFKLVGRIGKHIFYRS